MENELALDDERRVKTLSPSALVTKRFLRNKLAIVGLAVIILMFLFSFVGPFFSPYGEYEVFTGYETVMKEFANISLEKSLDFTEVDGISLPNSARGSITSAIAQGKTSVVSGGVIYTIKNSVGELYEITCSRVVADYDFITGSVAPVDGFSVGEGFADAVSLAISSGESGFIFEESAYSLRKAGKSYEISTESEAAFASFNFFTSYDESTVLSYSFRLEAERALQNGEESFSADGENYSLMRGESIIVTSGGKPFALISEMKIQPVSQDAFLGAELTGELEAAIKQSRGSVTVGGVSYEISGGSKAYQVKVSAQTQLIKIYEAPSGEHWLGTDANGMDILTRLMYGGRISLLIGFIVVLIETVIGVVLGGIAGYFGGWADNLIMRVVDIFNCIPSLPLFIIFGAIMDEMKIEPQMRIYWLMLIMGVLSWPGIARLVRGQILSLREQEFMVAAEATGISVSRRIFRHLIPNVIPQLIVMATMGLGGIILTESTLSFFGLGVKYPFASWGNIINAVSNIRVMTNYLFVWIPAGLLILTTVLGFNFIGDGLRDAFDPKMKR